MATRVVSPETVDQYIKSFPPKTQSLLKQLRKTIKSAAPGAEEMISYGIAGYKQQGMLIYFAGFNNHVSVYPAPRTAPEFKKELAVYKGGKGTVQFPLDTPLPLDLVKRIIRYRLAQNLENAAAKKAAKPKTTATVLKKPAGKASDAEQVKSWLDKLDKKTRAEIDTVRKIITGTSSKLSERIKWNAPSYYYKDDIVTFGPYRNNRVLLVFHHPAVVKVKSDLLKGEYKDRRLVYFNNKAEAEKNKKELGRILTEIIRVIDKK